VRGAALDFPRRGEQVNQRQPSPTVLIGCACLGLGGCGVVDLDAQPPTLLGQRQSASAGSLPVAKRVGDQFVGHQDRVIHHQVITPGQHVTHALTKPW